MSEVRSKKLSLFYGGAEVVVGDPAQGVAAVTMMGDVLRPHELRGLAVALVEAADYIEGVRALL